nr:hypothetical protein [Mesorhizobium sp.]
MSQQPDFGPSRTGQAIIRKEGYEGRLGGRNAAISSGAGKQPFLDINDPHVDAGIGKKPFGVAAARIHHHDFKRNILVEDRPDRAPQFGRRLETNHHDGEVRPLGHQARCGWAAGAENRRRSVIFAR